MRRPEPALEEWLAEFAAVGGVVVRLPDGFDRDEFVRSLRRTVQPGLVIEGPEMGTRAVWCVTRTDGSRLVHLIQNTASTPAALNLQTDRGLVERSTCAGHVADLSTNSGGYALRLAPYELVILEDAGTPDGSPPRVKVRVSGPMKVQPLSKNLLRLGNWRMRVGTSPAVAVRPSPIINQLTDNRVAFAAQADPSFGWPMQLTMPPIEVRYETEFHNKHRGKVELVMEPGALAGDWSIRINGGPPLRESKFKPTKVFVRGCVGVDVTKRLRRGINKIVVELRATRQDHGLRSPLYLAGDFGVTLKPPGLSARPDRGKFEAHDANALPFYAGIIEYETSFTLAQVPATSAIVEFDFGPAPFTDAADVSVNSGDWHAIPWSPRTALLPAGVLRKGENDLIVRVYTSLMRAFDGTRLDHATHNAIQVG
jgi:hypothetical protein